MCHESTSVALPKVIGVPVGTVLLHDFDKSDCIFFFGHNTTTNAPRMLHPLQRAAKRGVPIVTFNPLREAGLERFTNPQSPVQMVAGGTRISSQYYQVNAGGDIAAIVGISKAVIEADDEALAERQPARHRCCDFIAEHTHGFEDFARFCRAQDWAKLEARAGLTRSEMRAAAETYMRANAVIANYGMGITQHEHGVECVKMIVNLLLLRGNIGKPGAGISPIRGHSNVQGQRTVGITEKTKLVPLDKLKELYGFEPPREDGLTTVDACQGILDGKVRGFVSLGGNFVRAIPDRDRMEAGLGQASSFGPGRDQAQSQPLDSRRSDVSSSLPRPHRNRYPGHRAAGRFHGGFHGLHPWLTRSARAGERPSAFRALHCRGSGQGDAAA